MATGAEPLLVTRIDSGSGAVGHMETQVKVPPWGSSVAPLPKALGENGAGLLDCPTEEVADDEVSWRTSSRYRDLQHPTWPRPHSRLAFVSTQLAKPP